MIEFSGHQEADTRIFAIMKYAVDTFAYDRAVLVANDTDILVMSLYFSTIFPIELWLFRSNSYILSNKIIEELSIHTAKSLSYVASQLLAAYILSGCDSTSYPFKKGKKTVLKTLLRNINANEMVPLAQYPQQADVFQFTAAASYFFKCLYGRPNFEDTLDHLRAHLFKNCKMDLRTLPPTEDAFIQHAKRSAYTLFLWKNASDPSPKLLNIHEYG